MTQQYLEELRLTQHLIRHCNPPEKTYYDSLMLRNGGKLIIKQHEIKEELLTNDFQKITED